MKSKATSIRYDMDKMQMIQEREGLKTVQKVIDFLIAVYDNKPTQAPKTMHEKHTTIRPARYIPPIHQEKPEKLPGEATIDYLMRISQDKGAGHK